MIRSPQRPLACLLLALGLAWLSLGSVQAADDKKDKAARALAEKLQRAQQAQMQLQDEKNQLVSEKASLEKELVRLKADVSKLQTQLTRHSQEAKGAESEHQNALKQLNEQSVAASTQASQQLAQVRAELQRRTQSLQTCEAKNEGMYQLNTDLLNRYEKSVNPSAAWFSGGPLTKLAQVKLENEVTQLGDELQSLRLAPAQR
jgi:chromosome segregation ATPase